MTASDILDTLAPLLAGIPVAGPWIAAGLGLASRAARAGLSPEHITRIDLAALGARRAEADARLDALATPGPGVREVAELHRRIEALAADAAAWKEEAMAAARHEPPPADTQPGAPAFEYPDDPEPGEQGPGTVGP